MKQLRAMRELSTVAILIAEVLFFAWYLWPEAGRAHPFLNAENALLILKYSSIYGIAAVGAAVVIISGGIDLAPGAVIALSGVVTGYYFVAHDWSLLPSIAAGLSVGVVSGLLTSVLIVNAKLPPFIATLGMMGITRGMAFIITEGQYYDVSSRLPAGWRPMGVPIDWLAPIVMFAMALIFQIRDEPLPMGPLGVLDRRQRNRGALFRHCHRPRQGVRLCHQRRPRLPRGHRPRARPGPG